jgi:hypothetical protein
MPTSAMVTFTAANAFSISARRLASPISTGGQ